MVLFIAPRLADLQAVKTVLRLFGMASGLFSNLDKSVATPIGCSEDEINLVSSVLSCKIEGFPCRYLGIPLSVYKLKRADEQRLIDSVAARIPQWKGRLMNVAGRTALTNATLSAIPVHTSIAVGLSPWALKHIDKLRRAFHLGVASSLLAVENARWLGSRFAAHGTWVVSVSWICGGPASCSGRDGHGGRGWIRAA